MARDQQGYGTTNALLAVTSALGTLPGPKTVLFFAEGLAIPDVVLPFFNDVVTTANRGNVSVYTIDAAGLRVHSKDAETGRAVREMGDKGLAVTKDGSNRSSLAMLELNEDVLRKDPRTSLTLLADRTGGLLVQGTNDLAARLRQVNTDRRLHYLLTYTPKNGTLDGKWRTVRVPNRCVSVRARSGTSPCGLMGCCRSLAALDRVVAMAPPGSMPKAILEVLLEGRAIAKAPLAFPAIGTAGRVEHVFQLPVEQLASGRCTVRPTVAQGDAREVRESVMAIR